MAKLAKNRVIGNSSVIKKSVSKKESSLDTLAQLATLGKEPNEYVGFDLTRGTQKNDKKTLKKRARRKYLSTGLSLRLVDAEKQNPNSSLKKSYWNSYHCCGEMAVMKSGKVTSSYCKNRWCLVCNSIRTAQLIIKYKPILDTWEDKVMVTLTKGPRCKGAELKGVIEEMQKTFIQIRKIFNKRHERSNGDRFVGLRKLECTYDPKTNTYHPHFHLIMECPFIAHDFLEFWLKKNPKANRKAQDIRPADDNSITEVFKYFTKVITKSKEGESTIYADAMDVIFNAIKRKRTFQNFGFKVGKVDFTEEEISEVMDELLDVCEWNQDATDWVSTETGEMLSGYIAGDGMRELVTKKIVVRTHYNSS